MEDFHRFNPELGRHHEIALRKAVTAAREFKEDAATGRRLLLDLHTETPAQRKAAWTLHIRGMGSSS